MGERWDTRREQIFAVGARLFAEKGYERTSLQEVADLLGVTKPALYYYFRSKEQLLFEIMSAVMDRVLADVREVAEGAASPGDKLRELIRRYIGFFAAHPHELTLMSTAVDSLGPEAREQIVGRQREYLRYVRRIAGELLGNREDPEVDETSAAFALLGGMNWIFKWYDPSGRICPEDLVKDFSRIFAYGLPGDGR